MLLASGIFKLACAPMSGWIRDRVPRAGLLGSLTAIALVLISFLPLLDIAAQPVAGLVALGVMLATLTARWQFPRRVSGGAGAVVVGCLVYYGMHLLGLGPGAGRRGDGRRRLALRAVLPLPVGKLAGMVRGVVARGARLSCRWRYRWPWRRWSAGSTAPRVPRRPAMTIRPARSSRPRAWRRCSAGSSAG